MSESSAHDERRVWWREFIKRRLVRLLSAGLVGGETHSGYLRKLGMPASKIFKGYDVVDNDYFSGRADWVRQKADDLRDKQGLPNEYFLAIARFLPRKNLSKLIKAYSRYRAVASSPDCWNLVIVGDGAMRSELNDLVTKFELQQYVLLPGFKQYHDLPIFFGLARVFIHPSTTEQWGLVVNEAMASGLPVLVSNRCGCARDLVRESENGFTFDPGNRDELARLMLKVSAPKFPLSAFGESSRLIIRDYDTGSFALGLKRAVNVALNERSPGIGLFDRWLLHALVSR